MPLRIGARPRLALPIKEIMRGFILAWQLRSLIFRAAVSAAHLIEANVCDDAVEPGIKTAFKTEAVEIFVGLEEGFLINVARVFRAAR